jgi:hypothetical protein
VALARQQSAFSFGSRSAAQEESSPAAVGFDARGGVLRRLPEMLTSHRAKPGGVLTSWRSQRAETLARFVGGGQRGDSVGDQGSHLLEQGFVFVGEGPDGVGVDVELADYLA